MNVSLLPLDNFVVINKSIMNDQNRLLLTSLYQPIVGSIAINLYLTLWNFLDNSKINSFGNTHEDLINNMQIKLSDIKEAREKLEAIGLVKTFVKNGEVNNYIYELYAPLSAYEFINNPILSNALYNNISKKEYKRIIDAFALPKIDLNGYKDISCNFKDVYNFISSEKNENKNIRKANHLDLVIESTISFNEMLSLIPEEILNPKSICKYARDLVYELAFVYNFNNEIMSEIIKNSIEDRKINLNLLKENCRNYYKFENKGNIPKLVFQSQPLNLRQTNIENNKKAKLINQFETMAPYEFLYLKQGARPTPKDLETIEYLVIDQKLKPGVVNVLIDYVLKINNNKLVRSFVEQIAGQWKRSKIETVSDAIDIALAEYDNKKSKKQNEKLKKIENIPSWLDKKIDDEVLSDDELAKFEEELGV